ncbi:MAG: NADP-dependent oxidoreductase [Altibacter sp.]|uniref:NADP-dependent oxidoreductase n=1 Tax=Altibacter sp. TaxID=2024823 RepID=UPI001DC64C35|nr:NADP-dependent oxidoreductase [Altibacter sp.]MBZ0327137.1 NADP-dependent oxidoreductase [Altibacter sp.]
MKAIQFTAYGEVSNNIIITEVEKPSINKDEVLIETYAAGVNPLDIKVVEGKLKRVRTFKLPATLGYDVSGIIIEKGVNVAHFSIGDEVYSNVNTQGTFTEFVAVNQNLISLKPKNTTFEEAASLPLVGLTAIQSMKRGKLKANDKILIHAGSGGVGSFAIQYAKSKGAYVYTTTSTDNVEWVKLLGADRVIDYKTEDYKTVVKDVDMVLDTLGKQYTEDAFKVIKNGGKVITLVGPVDKETANRMKLPKIAQLFLAWKRRKITKQIKQRSAYYSLVLMRANAKQLSEITELVEAGKVKTNIDKVFPLSDALNALLYVKKGRTKGKVVINIKASYETRFR